MTAIHRLILLFLFLLFLGSCSILGIHYNLHNPSKQAKYPKFTEEVKMLGELSPIRKNFDVKFYNIDIQISPKNKELGGIVEIQSIALSDIDSIQLDLDNQFIIDELRWVDKDGENLNYMRKYRAILIKLPSKIHKGQEFSIFIKYHGKPIEAQKPPWKGGLVWEKDEQKNPWIGVACETEGASVWFPCKDHTSDEADSVKLRFTIPDTNLMVVSNGVFVKSEIVNNSKSFCWKVSYPINTYNITFYVGNYKRIDDHLTSISKKEILLSYYVLKNDRYKAAAKHLSQVKKHIKIYEELYGEYPWIRDGFKLIESPYAGMEHQSAIAYGNGYKNDLLGKEDYIILHETGHEWFGNAVTVADLSDVWIQEGFTTYGEYLYIEKMYGKDFADLHMIFYRWTIKNKRPMVGPTDKRYFNYKDGDVYVKGAWTLHTFRNQLNNDGIFFKIIKTFYEENKYKLTDSKTFVETVNRITKKDYSWFFNQYLYQHKAPILEYFYDDDGYLYYRWIEVNNDFNKLSIELTFDGKSKKYTIYPDSRVKKLLKSKVENSSNTVVFQTQIALFGTDVNKNLKKIYLKQGN